jgi:hypothetical protein
MGFGSLDVLLGGVDADNGGTQPSHWFAQEAATTPDVSNAQTI